DGDDHRLHRGTVEELLGDALAELLVAGVGGVGGLVVACRLGQTLHHRWWRIDGRLSQSEIDGAWRRLVENLADEGLFEPSGSSGKVRGSGLMHGPYPGSFSPRRKGEMGREITRRREPRDAAKTLRYNMEVSERAPTISEIRQRLEGRPGEIITRDEVRGRAAVAAILREPAGALGGDPEVLLIRRAERKGDPWSGHMALPGGRMATGDADLAATVTRETLEEIGLDLGAHGRLLGQLDDIA